MSLRFGVMWMLLLPFVLPAHAQENARYVVVLTETAAGAGEEVVETYGGRIERAIDEMTIEASVSDSRAGLMARDPRVKSITLASASHPRIASTSWTGGMSYEYDAAGNVTKVGNDAFVYDHVDRLVSDTVSSLERQHEYDAFGNRTKCTDVASGGDCQLATITGATNRIAGATYDEAGNLTIYSGKVYTYDASGMLIRDTGATAWTREYVYTADEERIAMIVDSTWYWTLRDFSGKVLREMTSTGAANGSHSNWQWTRDNVWRDGQLLSSIQPSGASTSTFHYHLDHLGTPRVVSNTSGTIVGVHDYAAFGMENSGNAKENPESRFKFTSHERDAQGGPLEPLDYMHARYYNAMWGRFLSVDPGKDWNPHQPQSWNSYAYVRNNPMKFTDPSGRYTAVCPPMSMSCLADAAAFENARVADLGSKRPLIVAGASSYGSPTEQNGVFVFFGNTGAAKGQTTTMLSGNSEGTGFSLTANVMVQSGLRGVEMRDVVAHEGEHVRGPQALLASIVYDPARPSELDFNKAFNFTAYMTEMNAYRVTAATASWMTTPLGVAGHVFTPGMSPKEVDRVARELLADPATGYGRLSQTNQGPTQTGW